MSSSVVTLAADARSPKRAVASLHSELPEFAATPQQLHSGGGVRGYPPHQFSDESTVVVHIEGASYRLRHPTDLIPETARSHANITPPPPPKRCGRPPQTEAPITGTADRRTGKLAPTLPGNFDPAFTAGC